MKRRVLVLILAIVMTLACVSCGNDENVERETTEIESLEEEAYLDDLEPTDEYRGVEFRTLAGNSSKEENFLSEAAENGTVIQEASYDCALQLEARFGIKLTYNFMESNASGHYAFLDEIRMTTLGGSATAYDLVVPGYWYGMTIAKGNYVDLNTVSTIDFSKPYLTDI